MKNIVAVSLLLAAAVLLNAGCSASASVKPASAVKMDARVQAAYISAPAPAEAARK